MSTAHDVLDAHRRGQPEIALARALDAWRATPHPVVEDVIAALDTRARADWPAPTATKRDDFHRLWMARVEGLAQDPHGLVALGWLSATITRLCPGGPDVRHPQSSLLMRIFALRPHAHDPRVAAGLAEIVARGAAGSQLEDVYGPILELAAVAPNGARAVLAQGDEPTARSTAAREAVQRWVRAHRAEIAAQAREVLPPDIGAWTALRHELVGPPVDAATEDELLAEVAEHVDDDRPRMVLADLWLAHQDPRGEYVLRALEDAASWPARALLKAHLAEWLGPDLDTVLTRPEFERGFLARASLVRNARGSAEVWARAAEDPRLGTLRELRVGPGSFRNYQRFLFSPATRNLVAIEIPGPAALNELCRPDEFRRFRAVEYRKAPTVAALRKMARAPAFDQLKTLWVQRDLSSLSDIATALDKSGWPARLSRLGLVHEYPDPPLDVPPELADLPCEVVIRPRWAQAYFTAPQ